MGRLFQGLEGGGTAHNCGELDGRYISSHNLKTTAWLCERAIYKGHLCGGIPIDIPMVPKQPVLPSLSGNLHNKGEDKGIPANTTTQYSNLLLAQTLVDMQGFMFWVKQWLTEVSHHCCLLSCQRLFSDLIWAPSAATCIRPRLISSLLF